MYIIAFWLVICIIAYFTYTAIEFYILAALVGFVMGGVQSLSRSTYSKILPETIDHTSYFADINYNYAAITLDIGNYGALGVSFISSGENSLTCRTTSLAKGCQ